MPQRQASPALHRTLRFCRPSLILGSVGKRIGAVLALAAWLAPSALSLDPRKSLTQYSRTIWTQERGLPQDTIRAVAQTTDGYLWLGPDEGPPRRRCRPRRLARRRLAEQPLDRPRQLPDFAGALDDHHIGAGGL